MNVLIVGAGKGSWEMRGLQIGAALGASMSSQPTDADWQWADVAILIKKHAERWAPQAHRFRVPIVWDVLDCWGQPGENRWTVDEGKRHIAVLQQRIKPVAMIAATQRMAADIGGEYIPHHCRWGLRPQPIRAHVWTVAYEGSERYLGVWEPAIRKTCQRRGWRFVINGADVSTADILVAFRDGMWDGPICRAWKSGVKFVNAIAAGRPMVTQPCAAHWELAPSGRVLVESVQDLDGAFDEAWERRQDAYADAGRYGAGLTAAAIATNYYRPLLDRVVSEAPCTAA